MSSKERIDKLLVERGLVKSRQRAQALILAGQVIVGEERVDKSGTKVDINAEIRIKGEDIPYVSRGGLKLASALDFFKIDPKGKVVMDVGSSTGGFTDCLLQRKAARIYAVDVGYGLLAWKLKQDPRVISLERRNIRYLKKDEIPELVDMVVIDTSFISVKKFLAHVLEFMAEKGELLILAKPQFEVGKGEVEKGGIVKDPKKHKRVVKELAGFGQSLGLIFIGSNPSAIPGSKGNQEFFLYFKR